MAEGISVTNVGNETTNVENETSNVRNEIINVGNETTNVGNKIINVGNETEGGSFGEVEADDIVENVNGENQGVDPNPEEADGEDEADGFITHFLGSKGTYTPRALEKESWGTLADEIEKEEDQHDTILHLLKNTAPEVRWREGLFYILKEGNKSETSTRKCLAFLHSNVVNGIKTVENGEECVRIENNTPSKCLKCPDWMMVMEGLNFELTSPGAVRDIEHVDVTLGKKTDTTALTGFCYLMKAMLDMTWTNLQCIPRIENKDGLFLHDALAALCLGYGLGETDRCEVEDLETKYPFLLKSLGFRRKDKLSKLQWQRPDPDTEFQNLCLTFHGLFRSADKIESVV